MSELEIRPAKPWPLCVFAAQDAGFFTAYGWSLANAARTGGWHWSDPRDGRRYRPARPFPELQTTARFYAMPAPPPDPAYR